MLETILKRLKLSKHGVSNVIVVMLSLVLIVIITANVIIWSSQMSRYDWEKTQEEVKIVNVQSGESASSWNTVQNEYMVEIGSHLSGSYQDTHSVGDGSWETFQEESTTAPNYRLQMNGTFLTDVKNHPSATIQAFEILLIYNASDADEQWFLEAYNWTSHMFSRNGFNSTSGSQPLAAYAWTNYAVDLSDCWQSYVNSDGVICVQFHDELTEQSAEVQTRISMDFLVVSIRRSGIAVTINNRGSLTAHIVSLWIIKTNQHERYNVNIFVNSGQNSTYVRTDIDLGGNFLIKIVTERGNISVFSKN